jgi:hypothetical protein
MHWRNFCTRHFRPAVARTRLPKQLRFHDLRPHVRRAAHRERPARPTCGRYATSVSPEHAGPFREP